MESVITLSFQLVLLDHKNSPLHLLFFFRFEIYSFRNLYIIIYWCNETFRQMSTLDEDVDDVIQLMDSFANCRPIIEAALPVEWIDEDDRPIAGHLSYHQSSVVGSFTVLNSTANNANHRDFRHGDVSMSSSDEDDDEGALQMIGSVEHLQSRIKIFLSGEPGKFFYQPIVLLDPQSIESHLSEDGQQAYISLDIQMWDNTLEAKVIDYLKQLPHWASRKFTVEVMPYRSVRLRSSQAYHLNDEMKCYQQQNQVIQFYLFCSSKQEANQLANEMKRDPQFATRHLSLECGKDSKASTAFKLHVRPIDRTSLIYFFQSYLGI